MSKILGEGLKNRGGNIGLVSLRVSSNGPKLMKKDLRTLIQIVMRKFCSREIKV